MHGEARLGATDDPVEHQTAERGVAVSHDVADPVGGRRTQRHEVPAVELRLHAGTRDRRVRDPSAERGRRDRNGELAWFSSSSRAVQAGVAQRFVEERAEALRSL